MSERKQSPEIQRVTIALTCNEPIHGEGGFRVERSSQVFNRSDINRILTELGELHDGTNCPQTPNITMTHQTINKN